MSTPPEPSPECHEPRADADQLTAALKAVPGVKSVSTKPTEKIPNKRKPNHFGVTYKLALPEGQVTRRVHCTDPGAADARPTLADALVAAIRSACDELGTELPAIVSPQPVAPPSSEPLPSEEELEWLAHWCESHEAPETVTVAMADAALRVRREAATTGPTRSGSRIPRTLRSTGCRRLTASASCSMRQSSATSTFRWTQWNRCPSRLQVLQEHARGGAHARSLRGWPPLAAASACQPMSRIKSWRCVGQRGSEPAPLRRLRKRKNCVF